MNWIVYDDYEIKAISSSFPVVFCYSFAILYGLGVDWTVLTVLTVLSISITCVVYVFLFVSGLCWISMVVGCAD